MQQLLPLESVGLRGLVYRRKLSQCLGDGTWKLTSVQLHPGETKINLNSVSVESIQRATLHLLQMLIHSHSSDL